MAFEDSRCTLNRIIMCADQGSSGVPLSVHLDWSAFEMSQDSYRGEAQVVAPAREPHRGV